MKFLIGFLVLTLSATVFAANYDKNYYIQHTDKMVRTLQNCESEKEKNPENCQNALAAMQDFQQLWNSFRSSPSEYGMAIMNLQNTVVSLKQQIAQSDSQTQLALNQKLQDTKDQINMRYDLLRMITSLANQ